METEIEKAGQSTLGRPSKPKNTGWAIITSIILAIVFYVLYRMLFTFIVAAYSRYDYSFATGLGALILLVFGTNILSFVCGTIVARRAFPKASGTGMFYSLATLLVVLGAFSLIGEMRRYDYSVAAIVIQVFVLVTTVLVLKFLLLDKSGG